MDPVVSERSSSHRVWSPSRTDQGAAILYFRRKVLEQGLAAPGSADLQRLSSQAY